MIHDIILFLHAVVINTRLVRRALVTSAGANPAAPEADCSLTAAGKDSVCCCIAFVFRVSHGVEAPHKMSVPIKTGNSRYGHWHRLSLARRSKPKLR